MNGTVYTATISEFMTEITKLTCKLNILGNRYFSTDVIEVLFPNRVRAFEIIANYKMIELKLKNVKLYNLRI